VVANAAEDADDLHQEGIAALKDSQTNPAAIVMAARCFAKASALYEAGGKTDLAVEMNSYLYWCKKKMTLADIDAFLKGAEGNVSERFTAVDKKVIAPSESQTFLDRADAFARTNPDAHLLIAVRYFEVADRFKGSDPSLKAQEKSLKEMMAANAPKAIPAKSAPTEVDIHNPTKLDGAKTDLLKLVDLRRDPVSGNWAMPLGLLSCAKPAVDAKLKLQSQANSEYDFHMVCARNTDEGDINVILNFQQQRVVFGLAGFKNTISVLHKINGKMGDVNGTRVLHSLNTNVACDVKIQVRKTFIRVLIDDKELFSHKLDGLRLSVDPSWETDRASISIWCVHCSAQFKEIDITEAKNK